MIQVGKPFYFPGRYVKDVSDSRKAFIKIGVLILKNRLLPGKKKGLKDGDQILFDFREVELVFRTP